MIRQTIIRTQATNEVMKSRPAQPAIRNGRPQDEFPVIDVVSKHATEFKFGGGVSYTVVVPSRAQSLPTQSCKPSRASCVPSDVGQTMAIWPVSRSQVLQQRSSVPQYWFTVLRRVYPVRMYPQLANTEYPLEGNLLAGSPETAPFRKAISTLSRSCELQLGSCTYRRTSLLRVYDEPASTYIHTSVLPPQPAALLRWFGTRRAHRSGAPVNCISQRSEVRKA